MQSPRCRLVAGPSKGHHPQQQHYSAQRRAKTALPALASTFFPPTTSLLSEEDMCMCIHNKAVGCPGACRSHPPINYYGCGLVLAPPRLHPAFAPRETMTFVGLDDECLESFCKAEGRANELDRCSAALCTCRDACRPRCRPVAGPSKGHHHQLLHKEEITG